jgi:ABC-type multidrug transport system ATPase subunit
VITRSDAAVVRNGILEEILRLAGELRQAGADDPDDPDDPGDPDDPHGPAGDDDPRPPVAGTSPPPRSAPSAEPPVLRAVGVGVRRRGRFVIEDVTVDLWPGEIAAVVGRNGSGKTTLLDVLALRLAPTSGSVDLPSLRRPTDRMGDLRDHIGHLPQTPGRLSGRVGDLLEGYAMLRHPSTATVDDELAYLVERFELAEYADHRWGELSGGYRTRFHLVCLLLGQPALMVLDEPLAALDPASQVRYLETLRDLARSPRRPAIVISSQHVPEAEAMADTVIVLADGGARVVRRADRSAGPMHVVDYRGSLGPQELEAVLRPLGRVRVRPDGVNTRLRFGPEVDPRAVGRVLFEAGSVQYLLDLSGSARLLIEEVDDGEG